MEYIKPEVAVLGDAARLIQGSKNGPTDGGGADLAALDRELDD